MCDCEQHPTETVPLVWTDASLSLPCERQKCRIVAEVHDAALRKLDELQRTPSKVSLASRQLTFRLSWAPFLGKSFEQMINTVIVRVTLQLVLPIQGQHLADGEQGSNY